MYKNYIFSSLLINSTVLERRTLFVRQQTVVCKVITYLYDLQTIQIGDKTRSRSHYSSLEISKESTSIQFYSLWVLLRFYNDFTEDGEHFSQIEAAVNIAVLRFKF